MSHIRTRDYNMVAVINGATKAGTHRDNRKHYNKVACRGNQTAMLAKKKSLRSVDWIRPGLHGDEVFEICYDDAGEIVEVYFIDEGDNASHFNISSFNEQELTSIRETVSGEMDSLSYP